MGGEGGGAGGLSVGEGEDKRGWGGRDGAGGGWQEMGGGGWSGGWGREGGGDSRARVSIRLDEGV